MFTDCRLYPPGAGIVADALRVLYVPAAGSVCLRGFRVSAGTEKKECVSGACQRPL